MGPSVTDFRSVQTRLGMPIKLCDVTEYIMPVLARVELNVYWNSVRIFTLH